MKLELSINVGGITKRLKDGPRVDAEIRAAASEWQRALTGCRPERTVRVRVEFGLIPENPDSAARTYRAPHPRVPQGFGALIVISNGRGMSLCHKGTSRLSMYFFGSIELFTLALHELGHAIGLPHNEEDGAGMDSIMDARAPFSCHKGISRYDAQWAARRLNAAL